MKYVKSSRKIRKKVIRKTKTKRNLSKTRRQVRGGNKNEKNWELIGWIDEEIKKGNEFKRVKRDEDDEIEKPELYWEGVSENPNAINLLRDRIQVERLEQLQEPKINWRKLSANPGVCELLKDQIQWEKVNPQLVTRLKKIDWSYLSANPGAIELLRDQIQLQKNGQSLTKIYWGLLAMNPNPEAIELLKENKEKIDWSVLSKNSNAIELLRDQIQLEENEPESRQNIDWQRLASNPDPDAIDFVEQRLNSGKLTLGDIDFYLMINPSDKAFDLHKRIIEKNPNPKQKLIKLINLARKSSNNPNNNAIDFLEQTQKENPKERIIRWRDLSKNPCDSAIRLLTERVQFERNNEGDDEIDWSSLSRNPNAIDLLKEQFEYEKTNNNNPKKIHWPEFSENPNREVIDILEENKDKIRWKELSTNPYIFVDTNELIHNTLLK
jgi:hypothetical protein